MAAWYVWSGATGTGTGASWANAKTTLSAAITAAAAGDTYYVASDHSASYGSATTLTFKGTAAAPDTILSVSRAGSVPPVSADLTVGAIEATTTTNALTFGGFFYCWGVTFNCGTSTGGPNLNLGASYQKFEKCTFGLLGTGGSLLLTNGFTECINCSMQYGASGQLLYLNGGVFIWRDSPTPFVGGVLPTNFFYMGGTESGARIEATDLSQLGSGKTIVNHATGSASNAVQVVNCKLGASVTVSNLPTTTNRGGTEVTACHTAGNVERNERYCYQGTLTTETVIVRSSGASDGTTAYSWKIVATANNNKLFPFRTFEGAIWNAVTGSSKTLTVHTVTDNVTLTNGEAWLEVEYLGSSGTPITTLVRSAPADPLASASSNPTDAGATWTTTGLTTPIKQSFSVTFTPQMAGPVRWRICYAKASSTVYVCPKAELV